ncbi:DUF2382 domain-containing protein [Planococcus shixiaomingii]|uniref:DUF2382 domain-containing protein n=1 Tax=Planococcus shixiaomingii TaxID=3058393 RepID=UPI0026101DBB|nr:DUF2382 domain-containing protein [Planococcus sp. N022]WKA54225.1 DUF2382 domain-containing protein [Planococcus sp. N022]
MADNKFMGTFDTEQEVLRKIEEMKALGATEDHMYVMARDKDQISMVRGRTDVDYKSAEGSWKDKFMGFLSGNEPVRQAFAGMGVDEQEADRYYQEVQNGKILLFVDRDYIGEDQESRTSGSAAYGSSTHERHHYPDSGAVGRDGLTVDTNDQNDVYFNEDRRALHTDESSSSRTDTNYDETAGVGDKTGTGFGLGTGSSVNDTPRADRDLNDFSATNRDRDSSASSDSSTGMFGSGGQGADERTTTNQSSGLFGSDTDRDRRGTDTFGTDEGSKTTDSGTFDSGRTGTRDTNGGIVGTGFSGDSNRSRTDDRQGGTDLNRDTSRGLDRDRDADEETLRLHEERLQVDKDRVQTGEVNIGKRVVEEKQTIDVPVEREEIVIERRPVNEEVTDASRGGSGLSAEPYAEGDSIHIPLTEERVEVNKTNVVSEEIIVGKRKVQDTETVNETVRREEADIDDDTNNRDLNSDNRDVNRDKRDRI